MFGALPSWWTTAPPEVNLVLMVVAFVAACRAATLLHRAAGYATGFVFQYLGVAVLSGAWIVALALWSLGVITRVDYLDLVGPLATIGRVFVWTVPSLTAANWVRHRRRWEDGS